VTQPEIYMHLSTKADANKTFSVCSVVRILFPTLVYLSSHFFYFRLVVVVVVFHMTVVFRHRTFSSCFQCFQQGRRRMSSEIGYERRRGLFDRSYKVHWHDNFQMHLYVCVVKAQTSLVFFGISGLKKPSEQMCAFSNVNASNAFTENSLLICVYE